MVSNKKGLLALSPIAVLLTIYLAGAYFAGDFYRVPITVSFFAAAIYGLFLLKGKSFNDRVKVVSEGASHPDIMYMIWIFCLAGFFAASAKAMGAVDATVALTMKVVPSNFMPAGIFIASCFISMAIGTSVGTIVALTPMVTVMAPQIGCETAWLVAVVVGGAFFGELYKGKKPVVQGPKQRREPLWNSSSPAPNTWKICGALPWTPRPS